MTIESYIPHMLRDKKVISGKLRLVIPTKIGQVEVMDGIEKSVVLESINNS